MQQASGAVFRRAQQRTSTGRARSMRGDTDQAWGETERGARRTTRRPIPRPLFFQYRLVPGAFEFLLCLVGFDHIGERADLNSEERIRIIRRRRQYERAKS